MSGQESCTGEPPTPISLVYENHFDDLIAYGALHTETPYRNLATFALEASARLVAAQYDGLTEQLNKMAFHQSVEQWIESGRTFGLMYFDLTNFKAVNDKLSHEHGDRYLADTANILRFVMQESFRTKGTGKDMVYALKQPYQDGRLGGDEMAVLVDLTPRQDSHMKPKKRLKRIKQRVLGVFYEHLDAKEQLGDFEYKPTGQRVTDFDWRALGINIAVGYAVYDPAKHGDASALIAEADSSMQRHKAKQHEETVAYRDLVAN